ncbi:MAG: hypothetical protein HRT36_01510 [Alphaproteobacteria bacterium]|nr:hypothetical protein [Alphaproteobacteria bacterium]
MNSDDIDLRTFDHIAEIVSSLEASRPVVIDNGAAGFIPLCAYVVSNDIVGLFKAMEHTFFVHTLILGGQSLSDTLSGYVALAELVVWMNGFFGVMAKRLKTWPLSRNMLIASML